MPRTASTIVALRERRRTTLNVRDAFHTIVATIGGTTCSEADIYRLVNLGISIAAYSRVAYALGLPKRLIASEAAIRRRRKTGTGRLTPAESERLIGILRTYAMACTFFGNTDHARAWLNRPARFLPNAEPITPIALSLCRSGVRLLEERMLRTTHGMF